MRPVGCLETLGTTIQWHGVISQKMETLATTQNPSNSQRWVVSKFRETVQQSFQPDGCRDKVVAALSGFILRGFLFRVRRWMRHENRLLLFLLWEERRQGEASSIVKFPRLSDQCPWTGRILSSSLLMTAVCYSAPPPSSFYCWNYFCTVVFFRMFPFSSFARVRWWMIPNSISSYIVLNYHIRCILAPYWFNPLALEMDI